MTGADPRCLELDGPWWVTESLGETWRLNRRHTRAGASHGRWLPATVPGSIHWDLLVAGEIDDPYAGRNSRHAEWVHQRSWVYRTSVAVPEAWVGSRIFLELDGIDDGGEIHLDDDLIATAASLFDPVVRDVTDVVQPGRSHHLAVVVGPAPDEQSQIGRSSHVRAVRGRMGYGWDFACRLVNLGVWQPVRLRATGPVRIDDVWVRPGPVGDDDTAAVTTTIALDRADEGGPVTVRVILQGPGGEVVAAAKTSAAAGAVTVDVTLEVDGARRWWPNGRGGQPVYRCTATAMTLDGAPSDERTVTFGFVTVELVGAPWPPPGIDADGPEPLAYTLCVNGERIFMKGWNWVPVDEMYARPGVEDRYRQLVTLARDAGVNLLRVWGGGLVERELFYDLCDEAGILVWQEFTQSSSGVENCPPRDPQQVDRLVAVARTVVPLRRNHVSLTIWCGGNELTDLDGVPVTVDDANIAALAAVVAELDPGRAFLPTSGSGPVALLDEDVARQRPAELHDVHGTWHYTGPVETYVLPNISNVVLHSEYGTQGACAATSLDRFMDASQQWPPDATNPAWLHHGAWWMHREAVEAVFGTVDDIAEYTRLSQFLQADSLRYLVDADRRRWPYCAGTMPWQLHEPWPNAHCTSSVDYYLRPKMAYAAVAEGFAPVAASLRHDGQVVAGDHVDAAPFVVSDEPFTGQLQIEACDVRAHVVGQWSFEIDVDGVQPFASVQAPFPDGADPVLLWFLRVLDADRSVVHRRMYAFGSAGASAPLAALRRMPAAPIRAERVGDDLVVTNDGDGYALFATVDSDDQRFHVHVPGNFAVVAPSGSWACTPCVAPRACHQDPDRLGPSASGPLELTIAAWNSERVSVVWER